jgi:hypothetical protein
MQKQLLMYSQSVRPMMKAMPSRSMKCLSGVCHTSQKGQMCRFSTLPMS